MSDETQLIRFGEELPLWPETFTDCILCDLNEESIRVTDTMLAAVKRIGKSIFQVDPVNYALYTDDQVLTEELKAELVQDEIAFRHTHYPRNPNE